MSIPQKGIEGSNPSVSASFLIPHQFAALTAPMGGAGRTTPGRACEPCGFEMAPQCSATNPLIHFNGLAVSKEAGSSPRA
jgi:hypothetical protein